MSRPVGGINGYEVSGSGNQTWDDYKYAGVTHGRDDEGSKFKANYDEIDASVGRNRWHLQSYFTEEPYNRCAGGRSYNFCDRVFYRIKTYDGYSNFINVEPDQYDLDQGNTFDTVKFSVGVPITPFFQASLAEIVLDAQSGYVDVDNYNSAEWDIDLDQNDPLPTAQNPSDGVRLDCESLGDPGNSYDTYCTTVFDWLQVCGETNYYSTNSSTWVASYDVTN